MPGKRKTSRLKNYDYTGQGAYYITVCSDNHARRGGSLFRAAHEPPLRYGQNVFGYIKNGKMVMNDIGKIIHGSWLWLADQYDYVDLDEFIVMPNHVHGIILLTDKIAKGGSRVVKGGSRAAPTLCKPLGQLIGAFKTVSTKRINTNRNTPGIRLWQRNFYEHVIRDESDLNRIREYIKNNPIRWGIKKGRGNR